MLFALNVLTDIIYLQILVNAIFVIIAGKLI